MPRLRPVDVYQVYIDTTVLVDLADQTAGRHKQAQSLLRLFQRYQQPRRLQSLQIITSVWAAAEAHGVLYEKFLEKNGAPRPVRGGKQRSFRDTIPPIISELEAARRQLNSLLTTLQTTTSFLVLNDTNPDATQVWQLVNQIGHEAAIYPADSVHLALALKSGCSMLITDDGDFLDKIECCQETLIRPYRESEFSYIRNLRSFDICGVRQSTSIIPSRPQSTRQGAAATLDTLGFRFR